MELRLQVIFALKHKAEYDQLGREIYDLKSPLYHHWLTPEETHRRFGESKAEFDAVEQWLNSQGFKVTEASYGKSTDWIRFAGTVAQAEKTFRTTTVSATPGKYGNSTDAMIPARFKGVIGSIFGLDNFGGGFMIRPLTRPLAEPNSSVSLSSTRRPRFGVFNSSYVSDDRWLVVSRSVDCNDGSVAHVA
jgi:subtilase family serine protease